MSNDEKYIYRNKLNFEKYESTISNLFHYSTQYEFFDYSNMNEFEIRRKKQEEENAPRGS